MVVLVAVMAMVQLVMDRQKDGVSSCAGHWKTEGACILCNRRNADLYYQREQVFVHLPPL